MLCYVLNWESISYVCMIIFCIGAWILVVGATLNNLWTHIKCWVIWQVMVCLNCTTMMGYCNYLNINVKTSLNIFINFFTYVSRSSNIQTILGSNVQFFYITWGLMKNTYCFIGISKAWDSYIYNMTILRWLTSNI